jgi:hypothetical protein
VTLRVPGGEAIEGVVAEVAVYAPDDGVRRVAVHVLVELETFQRIADDELVGFVPGSTDPGTTDYVLLSTAPVELQLMPYPAALGDLAGAPVEALIDGVVAGMTAPDGGALQEAASFRWLAVMQEQALRPGVTIKRGFRSIYTPDAGGPA